jgi:hypothetical protein
MAFEYVPQTDALEEAFWVRKSRVRGSWVHVDQSGYERRGHDVIGTGGGILGKR